jgi:ABC-type antimicrobial peptide transport system permease subunit
VALSLALLGMLIVSHASIASRRTNFAALRALGMAPRQIAAVLIWEHGVLYLLALALGLGLGGLLSFNAVPVFTLLSGLIFANTNVSSLPNVPPIHLSFPLAQAALLFGGLLALNLLGLILMARFASQPALNQVLRLNED